MSKTLIYKAGEQKRMFSESYVKRLRNQLEKKESTLASLNSAIDIAEGMVFESMEKESLILCYLKECLHSDSRSHIKSVINRLITLVE